MLNLKLITGGRLYDLMEDMDIWVRNYNIGEAEPNTYYVNVPYRDGSLDLSGVFGKNTYKDRRIKCELLIVAKDYMRAYNELNRLFNGKVCKMILSNEDYYYEGRVTIGALKSERYKFKSDMEMTAYPYKYKRTETSVEVLASYSGTSITLRNSQMPVKPRFLSGSAVTIAVGDKTYNLPANAETQFDDLVLSDTSTEIIVTGTGTVTITYREGIL